MKIIFNPPDNPDNQYIQLLVTPLKENGVEVCALDDFFSSYRHFKSIQLVHLNWFENIDDSHLGKSMKSFFRKMVVLLATLLFRKRLVWTMHNRNSHEKKSLFFSQTLTRLLVRWSDRIVIHSWESLILLKKHQASAANKMVYLPHPHFIGVYGPIQPSQSEISSSSPLRLLFIGAVKPYKNMELLIELAKELGPSVHLNIAGKPHTEAYGKSLQQLSAGFNNINWQLRFIADQEIPFLLGEADLLILPYDLKSSLNSGTVLLAFSYKKSVICPSIGTIQDLGEASQDVFEYRYQHPNEHKQLLLKKVNEAIRLKKEHPMALVEKGERLYEYVKTQHDPKQIGDQLFFMYQQLLLQA